MLFFRLVDLMVRLAVNEENLSKPLVDLSAMVGLDGVPLHFQLFPKLWIDIFNTQQIDRKFIMMLVTSHGFLEYVDAVLLDERSSLNNSHVFNFLLNFFPKVNWTGIYLHSGFLKVWFMLKSGLFEKLFYNSWLKIHPTKDRYYISRMRNFIFLDTFIHFFVRNLAVASQDF